MTELGLKVLAELREGSSDRLIVDKLCKKYHICFEDFMLVFAQTDEYNYFLQEQRNIALNRFKLKTQQPKRNNGADILPQNARWGPENRQQVIDLYNDGYSVSRIAIKLGRSVSDVYRQISYLRDTGYTIRAKHIPGKKKASVS